MKKNILGILMLCGMASQTWAAPPRDVMVGTVKAVERIFDVDEAACYQNMRERNPDMTFKEHDAFCVMKSNVPEQIFLKVDSGGKSFEYPVGEGDREKVVVTFGGHFNSYSVSYHNYSSKKLDMREYINKAINSLPGKALRVTLFLIN